jgi:hypothetical protein
LERWVRIVMTKRRAALFIFPIFLTLAVVGLSPPLREVTVILVKDFQKDCREPSEPATIKCGYVEVRQPELMDLAVPLPTAQPKISFRRKARSNRAFRRRAR